ncbi:hypothetical protein MUY_003254 [Bacillus licheniformis WX-02]|jgi:hypothetical protein|nr:hypothetical protein MUY_003254 [Bacillus licheniformis WX-02]
MGKNPRIVDIPTILGFFVYSPLILAADRSDDSLSNDICDHIHPGSKFARRNKTDPPHKSKVPSHKQTSPFLL